MATAITISMSEKPCPSFGTVQFDLSSPNAASSAFLRMLGSRSSGTCESRPSESRQLTLQLRLKKRNVERTFRPLTDDQVQVTEVTWRRSLGFSQSPPIVGS